MSWRAERTIEALNAPHSPRSEVTTTIRWFASDPLPARSGGAPAPAGSAPATEPSMRSIRSA